MEASNELRLEILNFNHITMLNEWHKDIKATSLQGLVFRNWLAKLESNSQYLLPSKQPWSYVSFEGRKILSILTVKPINKRGTCWLIYWPKTIQDPNKISNKELHNLLIQKAIQKGREKVQSWLIECETSDKEKIATSRELGFQPLKLFNCWSPKYTKDNSLKENSKIGPPPAAQGWKEVSKKNAYLLWRLEKSSQSIHLRQILDRQQNDLENSHIKFNRVLVAGEMDDENSNRALSGIIFKNKEGQNLDLQLIRDIAWDNRLQELVIPMLKILETNKNKISVEISQDDRELNELMHNANWELCSEKILLGRTIWRRQENINMIKELKPLGGILGGLNPQQPPLPSPSNAYR